MLLQRQFGHESVLYVKHINELLTLNFLFAVGAEFGLQSKDRLFLLMDKFISAKKEKIVIKLGKPKM